MEFTKVKPVTLNVNVAKRIDFNKKSQTIDEPMDVETTWQKFRFLSHEQQKNDLRFWIWHRVHIQALTPKQGMDLEDVIFSDYNQGKDLTLLAYNIGYFKS